MHICLIMCVFSSHVTFHTCTILMYVVVCFYVSCNSFPDSIRKRPRLHKEWLDLREDRIWRMPLASPLDSPFLVNRRLRSAVWPSNETAELVQRALAYFCGYDRRPPTAIRNRHSDLIVFYSSVSNGGHDRRSWNRRMKRPKFPCISRDSFCGYVLRPGRRMKPQIGDFKGQTCLFTCPVLDVYKYLTFSLSVYASWTLRTLNFKERFWEKIKSRTPF